MKHWRHGLLVLLLATFPMLAQGQVIRPYPYPVRPIYPNRGYVNPYAQNYGPGYGYGATLSGAADLTRSYGDLSIDYEKARLLRESSNQAKLETKKRAFDLMMYEKANTPTYTETLSKEKAQILQRIMYYPVSGEIASGLTLNTMLPYLLSLSGYGAQGQPIPVSQRTLNTINVSANGTSSVGMFRDGGHVQWPIALQGKPQMELDKLLPTACQEVLAGRLNGQLMKKVRTQLATMRANLRTQLNNEEIAPASYMEGITFYNFLENSVNALERPDARKQLNGSFTPRAHNVQELVEFMADTGLQFAPATPGEEAANRVLHDAFVRYARSVQASAGFPTSSPIATPKDR